LKDNDSSVRSKAADALGGLGDRRALTPIKKALAAEKRESVRNVMQFVIKKLEAVKQ